MGYSNCKQYGKAALLLAHLNPVTNSHIRIISHLKSLYETVYVFPVRFLEHGREVNTRSFPFSYDIRRTMIESVLGSNRGIVVLPDYAFFAPYVRYLPPLFSPYSWFLRNNIIKNISESKFVSYTGDWMERIGLKLYRLNPMKASRLEISASSIKEMMYAQAIEGNSSYRPKDHYEEWQKNIPVEVSRLISDNWILVRKYASSPDQTLKIMGMKFPTQGFF
jgi:hypothetical protein